MPTARYLLWLSVVFVSALSASAQPTGYLTGRVTDDSTGKAIAYASVLAEGSFLGTAADANGRYLLELPAGEHTIRVQAVGYEADEQSVNITAGDTTHLEARLTAAHLQLGTITVEEKALREQPSVYRLTPGSIESAPSLGEPDVVRAAAGLPGFTQANDTKASLNVWGGASDQNKYLLDGIPVYSPGHLGGVFSAFNPKALEGADIYAGNFPARYGGRLSSVFSLRTKSRPDTSLARAHISLLSASVATAKRFGGTFVTAAARRTYLDPVMIIARLETRYNFHDANLKVTRDLGDGFGLEAIGFTNRDYLGSGISRSRETPDRQFQWGNYLGAVRLRRDGRRFDHRLTASVVQKQISGRHRDGGFVENRLLDRTAAYDGQWMVPQTHLRFGAAYKRLRLSRRWGGEGLRLEEYFGLRLPVRFTSENETPLLSGYLSAEHLAADRLSLQSGLRYSSLGGLSGGLLAPRFSVSYQLTDAATLTAGAGRYAQYVADARTGLGTGPEEFEIADGVPLFLLERPQQVWTYSLGAVVRPSPAYRIRATGYYRSFPRLAWLRSEASASFPSFIYGRGKAYGANVFLEKRRGWLTFQLGYAMAYPLVDRGEGWYTASWSIPHGLKGMLGFELGPWQLSLVGRYRSGLPFTPAGGRFTSLGSYRAFSGEWQGALGDYFVIGEENSGRLPAYWRADLALHRRYENRLFIWELYVQAINLLHAYNPLEVPSSSLKQLYDNVAGGNPPAGTARSLPIIPSLGAEITFK